MRTLGPALLVIGFVCGGATAVNAAEPYLEFLQGLRGRGYYDYALQYLDQIQARDDLPEDIRSRIPYEKGVTLMAATQVSGNPALQNKQLDQAIGFLEQFTKESPDHPLAGEANTQRARVLLSKGRVEIWQARSPSNRDNRAEFQNRARELIRQARTIFQTAHDQHKTNYESYPTFVDPEKDKARHEERGRAEAVYILAQLDLALCTYEEAQTYDFGSDEFNRLLTQASNEFELIHSKYRLMVGGLHARMWQGKCFEEQGDITKALGIYNELLSHPGTSSSLKRLQDQVRQFRLICLNHEQRKDYQLVIAEADKWLTENRGAAARSLIGLGIRWEQALAQEKLSESRELSPADRERLLRQSLTNARFINRYPGQYKDGSMFMIQRLQVALRGKDAGDPQDFDTAFGIARNMVVQEIGKKNEAIQAAKNEGKPAKEVDQLEEDRRLHLEETARILKLAMSLADDRTSIKDLNRTRYFLAYVNLLTRRNYESAILGEFVARHFGDEDPTTAQDSAYMAMAAYIQAYNSAPEDQKDVDMQFILRVCEFITTKWPDSDRATEARMNMGRIYSQMDQPAQAATWYSQVSESAAQFSAARIAAGQAFWTAYLNASILPQDKQPSADVLAGWQQSAQEYLRSGIDKLQQETPTVGPSPDNLIAAKVSLTQIILNGGNYQAAIDLLTQDPHPVMKAIEVEDESKRPEEGVTSRSFASLACQLLLRGYVGTQQLDQARVTMQTLERVAGEGGSDGEAVTQVYVQLGRELEDELKRLKNLGEQERLAEVRRSFETFLNDMFSRKDQTYGSLVWIAETYYGLGQGSESEPQQARSYFDKAATTYQSILDRATASDGIEADESRLIGVKLRLANCRRRQGDFEGALKLVAGILKDKPQALSAQIEAAYIYQDWAAGGQGDNWKKYHEAIVGGTIDPGGVPFWGWRDIGLRLQRLLSSKPEDADRYGEQHLEARYNSVYCRVKFAEAQSTTKQREEELQTARYEITAFVAVNDDIPDAWWSKFDEIYQQIQTGLGEVPDPLERPKSYPAIAATEAEARSQSPSGAKQAKTKAVSNPQPEDGGSSTIGLILVLLVFGAGGGFWFYSMKKNQGRRAPSAYAVGAPPVFGKVVERKRKSTSAQKQARARKAQADAASAKSSEPPTKPQKPSNS